MQNFAVAIIVVVAVLVGGWFLFWNISPSQNPPENESGSNGTEEPQELTFSSEVYDFLLLRPSGWQVSTTSLPDQTPAINAFPAPPAGAPSAPYIHHDNVTNVSVFPTGVPTEGFFGDTMPLDFYPGFAATNTIMFVTENGTPFAAYLQPQNPPSSWGEAGFVWIRVHLANAMTTCYDASGNEMSEEQCDPLTEGHRIVWNGSLDPEEWNTALRVLRSLELE